MILIKSLKFFFYILLKIFIKYITGQYICINKLIIEYIMLALRSSFIYNK